MADKYTRWVDLGEGKTVNAMDVIGVIELVEPPEWATANEKYAWNIGFRSGAVTLVGHFFSRLNAADLSAALKKALAE